MGSWFTSSPLRLGSGDDNMTRKQTERAYLAGILDGEGNIAMRRSGGRGNGSAGKYIYPRVEVKLTTPDILDTLVRITGLGKVSGPYKDHRSTPENPRQDVYAWVVTGENALKIVRAAYPYLHAYRRAQADIVLRAKMGRMT